MKGALALRWFSEAIKVLLVRAKLLTSNGIGESVHGFVVKTSP